MSPAPPPLGATSAAPDAPLQQQRLGRFGLSATPLIQQLLKDAAQHPSCTQELKNDCQQYMEAETIPWRLVQHACALLSPTSGQSTSADNSQQQPQLSAAQICAGSTLVLPQPPVRQRSAALQQRLAKLQEQLDSQAYAAMVADVTHDEQAAAAARQDHFFPTTKLQLSFGLHVIVTMGTFFALGYYAGHFVLRSQPMAAVCGCVGLVCGLLLETTLLILRTNMPQPLDQKYAHLLDKSWDQKQPQQEKKGGPTTKQQHKQSQDAGGNKAAAATAAAGANGSTNKQQLRRRRAA